jgi:hypothetical protein
MNQRQVVLTARIVALKRALQTLGPLHPGSLSRQRQERGGEYHHLSYSHGGKGHTAYVRPEDVPAVTRELTNYRKFRELIEQWLACEIELAKIRRGLATANDGRAKRWKASKKTDGRKLNRAN